jgi:hypothetical protein
MPVLRPISVVSATMVMPTTTMRLLWAAAPPLSVSGEGDWFRFPSCPYGRVYV